MYGVTVTVLNIVCLLFLLNLKIFEIFFRNDYYIRYRNLNNYNVTYTYELWSSVTLVFRIHVFFFFISYYIVFEIFDENNYDKNIKFSQICFSYFYSLTKKTFVPLFTLRSFSNKSGIYSI